MWKNMKKYEKYETVWNSTKCNTFVVFLGPGGQVLSIPFNKEWPFEASFLKTIEKSVCCPPQVVLDDKNLSTFASESPKMTEISYLKARDDGGFVWNRDIDCFVSSVHYYEGDEKEPPRLRAAVSGKKGL